MIVWIIQNAFPSKKLQCQWWCLNKWMSWPARRWHRASGSLGQLWSRQMRVGEIEKALCWPWGRRGPQGRPGGQGNSTICQALDKLRNELTHVATESGGIEEATSSWPALTCLSWSNNWSCQDYLMLCLQKVQNYPDVSMVILIAHGSMEGNAWCSS